jgi:nucleotide-binding universal stress UspA family protein
MARRDRRTHRKEDCIVRETPLVVVGVDGSDCSREALRFAVEEARRRGAHLRIVSAWFVPVMTYAGGFAAGVDISVYRDAATAISTTAVEEARSIGRDIVIEAATPEDSPAAALLEAAEDADLVVVGSRGHGGFSSLLLGSVSQQVALHAPCPVTIVRHTTAA